MSSGFEKICEFLFINLWSGNKEKSYHEPHEPTRTTTDMR